MIRLRYMFLINISHGRCPSGQVSVSSSVILVKRPFAPYKGSLRTTAQRGRQSSGSILPNLRSFVRNTPRDNLSLEHFSRHKNELVSNCAR